MKNKIELIEIGRYKDGGSIKYIDKKTNDIYWLCNKFDPNFEKFKGKLFKGNINDKKYNLAKGVFLLDNNKIINQ